MIASRKSDVLMESALERDMKMIPLHPSKKTLLRSISDTRESPRVILDVLARYYQTWYAISSSSEVYAQIRQDALDRMKQSWRPDDVNA